MPNIPENGPVSYCCRLEHVLVCPPGAHRANIAITVTLGMPPYDMIEHAAQLLLEHLKRALLLKKTPKLVALSPAK